MRIVDFDHYHRRKYEQEEWIRTTWFSSFLILKHFESEEVNFEETLELTRLGQFQLYVDLSCLCSPADHNFLIMLPSPSPLPCWSEPWSCYLSITPLSFCPLFWPCLGATPAPSWVHPPVWSCPQLTNIHPLYDLIRNCLQPHPGTGYICALALHSRSVSGLGPTLCR